MPSLTRNATPGPSTLAALGSTINSNGSAGTVLQSQINVLNKKERDNAFKRPSSETPDEGQGDKKRSKIDRVGTGGINGLESASVREKDKKKRRRRRRKRFSVVPPDVTHFGRERSTPVSSSQINTATYDKLSSVAAVLTCKKDSADEALTYSSSDKGKGKARSDSPASSKHGKLPASGAILFGSDVNDTLNSIPSVIENLDLNEQSSEILRLKEQLAQQRKLLERHQKHLNHQQQALTCQICLDLMHKPYALGPCGHVTCYDCLIRWFTAIQNFNEPQAPENGNQADLEGGAAGNDSITRILDSTSARRGTFLRRRKTCPICRTAVYERPAEMWGIKNMVSALVRSHLVELPEPHNSPTVRGAGERNQNEENGIDDNSHDPWRNVFRANHRGQRRNGLRLFDLVGHAPPHEQEEDRERFGWYDAEDGGIYRCVDCYHEIWDGVCSGCERVYHGLGDDREEEEEHNWVFQMPPQLLWDQNGDEDEDEDVYSDENQDDLGLDFGPGGWLVGTSEEEDDDDEDGERYGTLDEYFDALEEVTPRLWSESRRNLVSDPSDSEVEDEKSGDEEGVIISEANEGLRHYEENYITSDSEAVESVRDGMARITRSQTRRRRPAEVQSDSLSEGGEIEHEFSDGPGYFTRSRVRPVEVQSEHSEGDVRENDSEYHSYHYDGPRHFTRSCRRHLSDSDSDADYY